MYEYRDDVIHSVIFKDMYSIKSVTTLDKAQHALMRYYNYNPCAIGLGVVRDGRMKILAVTFLRTRNKDRSSCAILPFGGDDLIIQDTTSFQTVTL